MQDLIMSPLLVRQWLASLSPRKSLVAVALSAVAVCGLGGCGGGSDADSQSPQADAAPPAGDMAGGGEGYGGEAGYGGEPDVAAQPGGAYGGGAYGGGAYGGGRSGRGSADTASYGGEGYAGGNMASYGSDDGGVMLGYQAGGYAGEGYAGDMSGMGGGNPQFATSIQFVRQNCVQCHGQQLIKGETRLDGLTANFEEQRNATLWAAVAEQLDSGQMPPKSIPRRPDPRQQQAVVSWIRSSLKSANYVPLEQQDYRAQAEYAFGAHREAEAVRLLTAHSLAVEADQAQQILGQAKWSTVGLRPALTLRFAVGVILSAPDDLKDFSPLGTMPNASGGGGGSYGGETYAAGGAPADSGQKTLQQLTGAFGEELISKFESRWETGNFGTIFNNVEPAPATPAPGMGGAGYAAAGYGGGNYGGGGFGGSYGGEAGGLGQPGGESSRQAITPGKTIVPGLVYLGTGNQAELLKQAADLQVDGVFVFDVKAEQDRRRGFVNNDTRLRFMSLDGKTLAATSTLNNIDIARNKARGLEDDTLDKNISRFFAMFDERVRLESLPPLTADVARSRMRQLLVDANTPNLSKLFEARLYHSLQLLSDDELAQLYQIVLRSNDGLALAQGTVEDRRLVLDQLLTN